MPDTAINLTQLIQGMAVVSLTGDGVGHVAEVRDDFFKVTTPSRRRRDYWLNLRHVLEVDEAAARLILPRGLIGRYRLSRPEHKLHGHSVRQPLGSDGRS